MPLCLCGETRRRHRRHRPGRPGRGRSSCLCVFVVKPVVIIVVVVLRAFVSLW